MKAIVRVRGFLTKELREVTRQPSLVFVLILGPFLILLLFGLGAQPDATPAEGHDGGAAECTTSYISLLSTSERQAVQLAMLTLIASVFFSGFFLRLETFDWPVRGVSYLLHVTHGIQTLQEVMLRGRSDDYWSVGALSGLAVMLFLFAAVLLSRELSRAQGTQVDSAKGSCPGLP